MLRHYQTSYSNSAHWTMSPTFYYQQTRILPKLPDELYIPRPNRYFSEMFVSRPFQIHNSLPFTSYPPILWCPCPDLTIEDRKVDHSQEFMSVAKFSESHPSLLSRDLVPHACKLSFCLLQRQSAKHWKNPQKSWKFLDCFSFYTNHKIHIIY